LELEQYESDKESEREIGWGQGKSLRRTENPTAVPKAIGRRMEAAGFWKTSAGRVMEGMYVVIVAVCWCC
jgi:hypothetical protein